MILQFNFEFGWGGGGTKPHSVLNKILNRYKHHTNGMMSDISSTSKIRIPYFGNEKFSVRIVRSGGLLRF
jgi:hypothetical protein